MRETATTAHQPMEAVHADDRPWETLRWPGQWSKMLFHPRPERPTEPNAGLVRYEPGSHHPLHKHDFAQVWYILEGEFQIGERAYGPGTMLFHPDPHWEASTWPRASPSPRRIWSAEPADPDRIPYRYGSMGSMVKVTFTLDDETVQRLRRLSGRLQKPQSQVVRESIKEYEARSDTLSEDEQRRMLAALDRLTQTPPTRTAAEVDAELREIRRSRRRGWSTRAERRRR